MVNLVISSIGKLLWSGISALCLREWIRVQPFCKAASQHIIRYSKNIHAFWSSTCISGILSWWSWQRCQILPCKSTYYFDSNSKRLETMWMSHNRWTFKYLIISIPWICCIAIQVHSLMKIRKRLWCDVMLVTDKRHENKWKDS